MLDNVILGFNTYYPFGLAGAGLTAVATIFAYKNSFYFSPIANRSYLIQTLDRLGMRTNSEVNTGLYCGAHTLLALSALQISLNYLSTHKVIGIAKDLGK